MSADDPSREHDQYHREEREHDVADQVQGFDACTSAAADGSMREPDPGVGHEGAGGEAEPVRVARWEIWVTDVSDSSDSGNSSPDGYLGP